MNQLISSDEFTYYTDYFALAAMAGVLSAQAMSRASSAAINSDSTTFSINSTRDVVSERSTLLVNLQQSYSQILTEALTLEPMNDAFRALSAHIRKWTGGSVDEYLAANGLTVPNTYARISALVGSPISEAYISEV